MHAPPMRADTEGQAGQPTGPAGLPAGLLPLDSQEQEEGLQVRGRMAGLVGGLLLLTAHLPHPSRRIPAFLNSLTFNYYLPSA